ncbi:hypothetical protein [Streptomyces chartreusis]|uniref:hypothetical protein n=1 Tax=Streptomyces chartreusis TaxID=1969 RepID=UPI00381A0591
MEDAAVHLVTLVVERTGSEDAGYERSRQVLTWFLICWGVIGERAQKAGRGDGRRSFRKLDRGDQGLDLHLVGYQIF